MWHFPWSRTACGIYWSMWLYIFLITACFSTFGLLPFLLYDSAGTGDRICNNTNIVYLSNISSDPLFFTVALSSPLTLWHFRWDVPLCAAYPPHWFSPIHVTTSLPHRSSVAAWAAILLPDGLIMHCRLARCSLVGRLCHFKNSKHPFNVSQTDFKHLHHLLNKR